MQDPYQTLGVAPDASEEDVKKAYRTLSRKYHPDANINNPLKDEAEAKFKEIQQAYQKIMDDRERGYSSGYGGSAYGPGYGKSPYGSGYDGDGDAGSFGGLVRLAASGRSAVLAPLAGGQDVRPAGRARRTCTFGRRPIISGAGVTRRRCMSWTESRSEGRSGISTVPRPTPAWGTT